MMTLDEYYKTHYTHYYMHLSAKGKFKEGKGICANSIVKETEKEVKKHITSRRKRDLYVKVVWNNEKREINTIYVISEGAYNKKSGWENV